MFIKNITDHPIPNDGTGITHEGYSFVIPVGVCAIWDSAGEVITKQLFKVESSKGIDERTNKPDAALLPPIIVASQDEWDGKTCAGVTRFKISGSAKKISNGSVDNLLKIAEERGVDDKKLREWRFNASVEPEEIANAIDALPVPKEILNPVK